jgi:xanthine dehydrogenase YagR molybdenum-binding subunit
VRSVLAATVGKAFGLAMNEVEVSIGNCVMPSGPMATGSRSTATVVPAALRAVELLKAQLRSVCAGAGDDWRIALKSAPDITVLGTRPKDARSPARSPLDSSLVGRVYERLLRFIPGVRTGCGATGAVHVVEVEVDTLLGRVRVTHVHAGIAAGKPQVRELARSQVAGSIIQGLGYALYEAREVDPVSGQVLTCGLEDYRIAGMGDVPEIKIHFDEQGFEHVPGGGVGLGEVSTLPLAAAVANAIHNATGVRAYKAPILPHRVLAGLRAQRAA